MCALADKMWSMCWTIKYLRVVCWEKGREWWMSLLYSIYIHLLRFGKSCCFKGTDAQNTICICAGLFTILSKHVIRIHHEMILMASFNYLENVFLRIKIHFSLTFTRSKYRIPFLDNIHKCDLQADPTWMYNVKKKKVWNQLSAHVSSLEGIKNWWPVVIYLEYHFL